MGFSAASGTESLEAVRTMLEGPARLAPVPVDLGVVGLAVDPALADVLPLRLRDPSWEKSANKSADAGGDGPGSIAACKRLPSWPRLPRRSW